MSTLLSLERQEYQIIHSINSLASTVLQATIRKRCHIGYMNRKVNYDIELNWSLCNARCYFT